MMTARKWIAISGLTWLGIGTLLMVKGLKWMTTSLAIPEQAPMVRGLSSLTGSTQQAGLLIICLSLLIGFIKGRMVLAKTVKRVIERLRLLPSPIHLREAYDRRYLILLAAMMTLGVYLRFISIPLDIRGAIDVAIGSALINGSMLYFREAVIPSRVK